MLANQDFAADLQPNPSEPDAGEALAALYRGEDLTSGDAQILFEALVAGRLSEAEISAMLIALRFKGETNDELIGAARALRSAAVSFDRPDYLFADSCGTGGDESCSINVSTAVAFVAAAAGLPIAKHGNRSFTSRCGSADVLEALGAKIDLSPERSRQLLDETGVCFLFAPSYHPGLKHAGPARRALKVRTIMNVLGPCLNPARPRVQLLGVADPILLGPVAATLSALGVDSALIVHGSPLDEVALHGETMAVRLSGGEIEPLVLRPEDAGLKRAPLSAVTGGSPQENAERLVRLLGSKAPRAESDLVVLNAGALLMTAGLAASLRDGAELAAEAIVSGEAAKRLNAFLEASNG